MLALNGTHGNNGKCNLFKGGRCMSRKGAEGGRGEGLYHLQAVRLCRKTPSIKDGKDLKHYTFKMFCQHRAEYSYGSDIVLVSFCGARKPFALGTSVPPLLFVTLWITNGQSLLFFVNTVC